MSLSAVDTSSDLSNTVIRLSDIEHLIGSPMLPSGRWIVTCSVRKPSKGARDTRARERDGTSEVSLSASRLGACVYKREHAASKPHYTLLLKNHETNEQLKLLSARAARKLSRGERCA